MPSRSTSLAAAAAILLTALSLAAGLAWLAASGLEGSATATGAASPADPRASGGRTLRLEPRCAARPLQLLEQPHFSIGYDNQRKNPAWVRYELDGPILHPGQEPTRPPTFATDFRTAAHVSHHDYSASGFDRGHLWPAYAAWSRHGEEAFKGTFICSNIIPQRHHLNAGIWEELEVAIAGRAGHGGGWAETRGHLTIIDGPVYADEPERLRSGICIPTACFCIILHLPPAGGRCDALAFEIPNVDGIRGPLTRWLTTIRRIEDRTRLDIFAGHEEVRAEVENRLADRLW